jgi:hypothetical protein
MRRQRWYFLSSVHIPLTGQQVKEMPSGPQGIHSPKCVTPPAAPARLRTHLPTLFVASLISPANVFFPLLVALVLIAPVPA